MVERIPQGSSTNITDINVYIPELPLAGFGFLAHFVWEMLQVPWFIGMADAPHGSVVGLCLRATGGDVLILLASFWLSSIACGNRRWLLEGVRKPAVILVVTALDRDDRSGMAGDWPNGTMGIRGFHADYPAAGRGPGPGAAMASVAPANYVAGASAHARPYRASAPQLWLTASTYWQAGQVRALTLARHIDETRTSTQN